MTNLQDTTKYCMTEQLNFTKFNVSKARVFWILDKQQYHFVS